MALKGSLRYFWPFKWFIVEPLFGEKLKYFLNLTRLEQAYVFQATWRVAVSIATVRPARPRGPR